MLVVLAGSDWTMTSLHAGAPVEPPMEVVDTWRAVTDPMPLREPEYSRPLVYATRFSSCVVC